MVVIGVFLLVAFSSVFGSVFRLLLGNYRRHLERDISFAFVAGIVLGFLSVFYFDSIFIMPMTWGSYVGAMVLSFMIGYVLSDLFDTFAFIAKRLIR